MLLVAPQVTEVLGLSASVLGSVSDIGRVVPFTGTPNFLWVGAVGVIEFGVSALVTQRMFHVTPPPRRVKGTTRKRQNLGVGGENISNEVGSVKNVLS